MNPYLKNLSKIEFVLTYACTGRCIHCSEGDHTSAGERIDPELARDAVRRIAAQYAIRTVMVFGGEPLLHTDAVYKVMRAARDMMVPTRQVITNGCFTTDPVRMRRVAEELAECGVNDLILSVDAFHQATLPIGTVRAFARELIRCGVPTRLQPAWLVSPTDENPYNLRTRELLSDMSDLGLPVSDGNIVFPEGNALKHLGRYFTDSQPENPYREDPCDVRCVSFEPNGDVLGANAYRTDIMEILDKYAPTECD